MFNNIEVQKNKIFSDSHNLTYKNIKENFYVLMCNYYLILLNDLDSSNNEVKIPT